MISGTCQRANWPLSPRSMSPFRVPAWMMHIQLAYKRASWNTLPQALNEEKNRHSSMNRAISIFQLLVAYCSMMISNERNIAISKSPASNTAKWFPSLHVEYGTLNLKARFTHILMWARLYSSFCAPACPSCMCPTQCQGFLDAKSDKLLRLLAWFCCSGF